MSSGMKCLSSAINANNSRTVQALIDTGALLCTRDDVKAVMMAMICQQSLISPFESSILLAAIEMISNLSASIGSVACVLESLFIGETAVPIQIVMGALKCLLDNTQKRAPIHIMFLRLLVQELDNSASKSSLEILTSGSLFTFLGTNNLVRPQSLESVIECKNDPGDVFNHIILPALTIPIEDAITDACFLHICKKGFANTLEAIQAAAGKDTHNRWTILEPITECVMQKKL